MAKVNRDMAILVADDMGNMRRTLRGMLRNMGYENIREASNGEEAFEKIKSEKIDFLITDWNMPKMSGFELLKEIRNDEENKNLPVLMITAELSESQVAHAAETLVDGYIIKPFVFKIFEGKLNEVLEKHSKPHPIDTLVNVTKILVKGKQVERAVQELNKGLVTYTKSARLLVAMAEAMIAKEEYDKAESYYRKANEVNPLFTKAHEGLAEVLKKAGRTEEALVSLEKASRISPNNPKRQQEIGIIHLKHGDKTKAKVALNIAMRQAGKDHGLTTEIGEAFMEAGMADDAANAFKQSLSLDPKNLNVYNRLGIALRKKGRYIEAIAEYKKALLIAPKDEALFFNLAKALLEARQYKESLGAIENALLIDPTFKEARELQEELKQQIGTFG